VFTSLFIHFGFVHIFANMCALAVFGPLVERLYGSIRYLLIYLLAGVFGSLCSISAHPLVNSAGASGAIFGVFGALLATLTRGRNHIPPDVLRPVLNITLVYIGWSVYSSLTNPGIDYVAHMGGSAAGFILGWVAMPNSGREKRTLHQSLFGVFSAASATAILLIGGIWWAQSSVTSVSGEALYYRTVRWITLREPGVDAVFNAALRADDRKSHAALREILETKVIPFWQDASDRLAAVQLPKHSANVAKLDAFQGISDRRVQAFQLLDEGLRDNNPQVIATAGRELREIK
jgi:rhomboid protease GluP